MKSNGPSKKISVDELKAKADAGDADAQSALGLLFELGIGGAKSDAHEAAKWFGKAAKNGDPVAQFSLAELISREFEDNEENRAMAQALYKKAENEGFVRGDKVRRILEKESGHAWKVLLVDPGEMARGVSRTTLEAEACDVIEAKDGDDAIAQLKRHPDVRLILTEIKMPNVDGYELLRTLHANKAFVHIPVVFLTDDSSPEHIAKAKVEGVNGWILKPMRGVMLRRYLKKADLAKHQAKNSLPKIG